MPQCAVATCRNSHRRTRDRRIRYHRFPQIPEVRSRWVRACGRVPLANGEIPFNIQTARICSLHFSNDAYEKDMEHLVLGLPVRSRLRRGVVPTIGVPVNVQPVTKMLIEDAKRSLLKVAHAKMLNGQQKQTSNGHCAKNQHLLHLQSQNRCSQQRPARNQNQNQNQNHNQNQQPRKSDNNNSPEQKMAGIDVLLALGLKPAASRLNKMHAMDGNGSATQVLGNGKKSEDEVSGKPEESSAEGCPKVPQSHQNGAALPEETAAAAAAAAVVSANPPGDRSRTISVVKKELLLESESEKPEAGPTSDSKLPSGGATRLRSEPEIGHGSGRKRKSSSKQASSNGPGTTGGSGIGAGGGGGGGGGGQPSKKACFEDREQFLNSIVGGGACGEKITAEELALKAEQLRAEMEALDELARAKEMEWNEILSMRKLKEEAYLRIERKRQVIGFMEGNNNNNNNSNNNNNNNGNDSLPPATLTLATDWESHTRDKRLKVEEEDNNSVEENLAMMMMMSSATNSSKKERKSASTGSGGSTGATSSKHSGHQQQQQQQRLAATSKQSENGANAGHTGSGGRKQRLENPDNRQIGEGRQGPIVDVRSIIADYRLRHPETVPRRGRRMRNSVNVGLGAGGAMVENTGHNVDSRPSSTDSCKSNPNTADPSNSMSFKDVLVQFAKMSQQQGETVKTPQNYPDVTLHPVSPSPAAQNASVTQQSGSLLHGILTKTQSPRPTTFSPTLARLLTAPERDRNIVPNVTATPQQNAATQHLLQAYQGSNAVSISDLLSSSKARTEITITPVVSNPVSSHSNNLMHADDTEEESAIIEERESRVSGSRDNRDDRDSPPRCQGCHDRAAQFVCAGCGNQWYCSRECQVAAWDEHSEVCSG